VNKLVFRNYFPKALMMQSMRDRRKGETNVAMMA
jgi:hypothetical protein